MWRFDANIVGVIAIAASGCASDGSSAGVEPTPITVHQNVNSPTSSVPVPIPPEGPELGQLGPAPSATPMDPKILSAALADATVVGRLRELGLQLASIAGVSAPPRMRLIAAPDRQEVETISSQALIEDHASVFVIVMTGGRFIAIDHPRDVPAPEGSVLIATVDAASYDVTDVSIVNVEPDFAKVTLASLDVSTR